jgi:hypothetical protein
MEACGEIALGEIEPEEVVGFIYLMKSGRYYKIGRSNAAVAANTSLRYKCQKSSSLCTSSVQMIQQESRTIGIDASLTSARTESGSTYPQLT